MSELFFADVRRFFILLDIDEDHLVDHEEATLGLAECFEAVHRVRDRQQLQHQQEAEEEEVDQPRSKEKIVQDQVTWLFSAAAHDIEQTSTNSNTTTNSSSTAPPSPLGISPLTINDFELCYQRLLQSAYEQEVLHLDLTRGINAINSSSHWQSIKIIIQIAKSTYSTLYSQCTTNPSQYASTCFGPFLSPSASFSPKRQLSAQRLINGFITKLENNSNSHISMSDWLHVWKKLLVYQPDITRLLPLLQSSNPHKTVNIRQI